MMHRLTDVLVVDRNTADLLVQALDALEALAGRRNQRLAPDIIRVRMELNRFRSTSVDESTGVSDAIDEILSSTSGGWDTRTAARELGISESAVRQLIRKGRLDGYRHGGRWIVSARSVAEYVNERKDRESAGPQRDR
ncbi:helix-turn-helix domain-containing protein [Rhodococcus zopfii]|uniref:helix-turn-helix domain-containing protein n=1 Tax=Rhodococcus zopfii TaxID=43772 RepID=UPI0011115D82